MYNDNFAKLVTKLLANRLAGHLQQMVSPNQSAFIKGRFIQDNFMLVQQTARVVHQQKLPRFLLKLDISKAFDSVSWPFLLEVMQHLGFGQIWRDIISGLLGSSSTRVLLNRIPGEVILHRRGLRQGDPLSPMIFILVWMCLAKWCHWQQEMVCCSHCPLEMVCCSHCPLELSNTEYHYMLMMWSYSFNLR
jgi:hypothetical protein